MNWSNKYLSLLQRLYSICFQLSNCSNFLICSSSLNSSLSTSKSLKWMVDSTADNVNDWLAKFVTSTKKTENNLLMFVDKNETSPWSTWALVDLKVRQKHALSITTETDLTSRFSSRHKSFLWSINIQIYNKLKQNINWILAVLLVLTITIAAWSIYDGIFMLRLQHLKLGRDGQSLKKSQQFLKWDCNQTTES